MGVLLFILQMTVSHYDKNVTSIQPEYVYPTRVSAPRLTSQN